MKIPDKYPDPLTRFVEENCETPFLSNDARCAHAWSCQRARSDEVTLLAPGITPTKGALEKVIPAFENKTRHKVKVTYGSGLGTKEQVAKGQRLDASAT